MTRVTGLQVALRAFVVLLDGWREQFGPREYAVLLDLLVCVLEREVERQKRTRRRWAE